LSHGCMRHIGPERVIKELEGLFETDASGVH
jgi:hypothetical protein